MTTAVKTRTPLKPAGYDWGLLTIVVVLLALGLMMSTLR